MDLISNNPGKMSLIWWYDVPAGESVRLDNVDARAHPIEFAPVNLDGNPLDGSLRVQIELPGAKAPHIIYNETLGQKRTSWNRQEVAPPGSRIAILFSGPDHLDTKKSPMTFHGIAVRPSELVFGPRDYGNNGDK